MNAVEIEEAVSELAAAPFDRADFPYAFLQAFGNKETTLRKLRSGASNKSDVGGVLQHANIHILVTPAGEVGNGLNALRASPATSKARAKFILATDGEDFEAEDLETGETVACRYPDFPDHFGFFLALAGISTVKQIRESSFDIRATGRLNRLYVELLKNNPDWGTGDRRAEMNHFMARLIFCLFAEETDIFHQSYPFTATVERMSERDGSNTHEVIRELFRAMNIPTKHEGRLDDRYRREANVPRWADGFPYVNGQLFSGSIEVPRFSRIARSYLIHIGNLDWKKINPDIFGSMIQAVADDEERGALGMHYTSVPNILKVLNPLFLDDLRAQLEEAGNNSRKLLNLRNRMSKIRVFDPACGSGNFLVIAYKEMRAIEAEINRRRGEKDKSSDIPLTNFRGIGLREFPAEVARLALIIAEFQCDVLYRGQQLALAEFLPLDSQNWITCGNALRLDWESIWPPDGEAVKIAANDLIDTPVDQAQIDFENAGGETYICGNPPYKGSQDQSPSQKGDLELAFAGRVSSTGSADYVLGWFIRARDYVSRHGGAFAFVTTNSINQGRQVGTFWPVILGHDLEIAFGVPSFRWANLASNKAVVTVSIVGVAKRSGRKKRLFSSDAEQLVDVIGPYLVPNQTTIVDQRSTPLSEISNMDFGSMANDNGGLLFDHLVAKEAVDDHCVDPAYLRPAWGAKEFIAGIPRSCLWVTDSAAEGAIGNKWVAERVALVRAARASSTRATTRTLANVPYRFGEVRQTGQEVVTIVPRVTSESREYLPVGYLPSGSIVTDSACALYDAPLWNFALIASRLHLVWIATVCGKLKTDFRYSNTLGWNTFPVPPLTEKNKTDLTRCAQDVLLAREAHFPATIADLYDPEKMPDNLRDAHEHNNEVVERIYVGRRFRNDTERLEKLFDLYGKMSLRAGAGKRRRVRVSA
jgi:hypothetical protein